MYVHGIASNRSHIAANTFYRKLPADKCSKYTHVCIKRASNLLGARTMSFCRLYITTVLGRKDLYKSESSYASNRRKQLMPLACVTYILKDVFFSWSIIASFDDYYVPIVFFLTRENTFTNYSFTPFSRNEKERKTNGLVRVRALQQIFVTLKFVSWMRIPRRTRRGSSLWNNFFRGALLNRRSLFHFSNVCSSFV